MASFSAAKFLLVLLAFLSLLALAAASRHAVRPDVVSRSRGSVEVLRHKKLMTDAAVSLDGNSSAACSFCVEFMKPALVFLDAVVEAGEAKSCPDLCDKAFPSHAVDREICGAFCIAVGFTGFETLIRTGSPVWICEMLDRCDYDDSDTAAITANTVSPTSGKQGQVFTFNLGWDLEVWAGVGTTNLSVVGPDGHISSVAQTYFDLATGSYNMSYQLNTTPNNQYDFPSGDYVMTFEVCEGECDCDHAKGCKVAASVNQTITLKSPPSSAVETVTASSSGSSGGDDALPRRRRDLGGHGRAH
jgi:hypothetical protein